MRHWDRLVTLQPVQQRASASLSLTHSWLSSTDYSTHLHINASLLPEVICCEHYAKIVSPAQQEACPKLGLLPWNSFFHPQHQWKDLWSRYFCTVKWVKEKMSFFLPHCLMSSWKIVLCIIPLSRSQLTSRPSYLGADTRGMWCW